MANWIKGAINPAHKGEFAAKAKAAGMSTSAYAAKHAGDSGKLGKQARLAETLIGLGRKKKKSAAEVMYPKK